MPSHISNWTDVQNLQANYDLIISSRWQNNALSNVDVFSAHRTVNGLHLLDFAAHVQSISMQTHRKWEFGIHYGKFLEM